MNLHDIYEIEGTQGLKRLADIIGCNRWYLYQIATGRRTPSSRMGRKLIAADRRIKWDDLYPEDLT